MVLNDSLLENVEGSFVFLGCTKEPLLRLTTAHEPENLFSCRCYPRSPAILCLPPWT